MRIHHDPWLTQEADFPTGGSTTEQLCFLLNYAVLAPSGHNTQPWLFRVDNAHIELWADRTRCLPVVDPEDRSGGHHRVSQPAHRSS